MRSHRIVFILCGVLLIPSSFLRADSPTKEAVEPEQSPEGEGLIPNSEVQPSTGPVTPISPGIDLPPYDQARGELIKALQLWNAGDAEAASDVALEAYEDLIVLHRVPGVKRSKIRKEAHEAAGIYIDSSIAFLRKSYNDEGQTPGAKEDTRARLEDLRDVARNYPELEKKLNAVLDHL